MILITLMLLQVSGIHLLAIKDSYVVDLVEGDCYELPLEKTPFIPHFSKYQILIDLFKNQNCTGFITTIPIIESSFQLLNGLVLAPFLPRTSGANYKFGSKEHGINCYLIGDCSFENETGFRYTVLIQNGTVIEKLFIKEDEECIGTPLTTNEYLCGKENNGRFMDCSRYYDKEV